MNNDNSQSFKYKAALVWKTTDAVNNTNNSLKCAKVIVPLKCLSNFCRSSEMPLINSKIHLKLNRIEDWILSTAGDSAKLKITDARLHVSIITLSAKDIVNLTKQLSDRCKRSVYCNSYQTIPAKVINKRDNIYELLNESFQSIKWLFVLAHANAARNDANNKADVKDNRKYFLPRGKFENCNVLIDGRNFCSINDLIKQFDEVRKITITNNMTGWWLSYRIFITLCIF